MLKAFSYINIVLALVYYVSYLMNSYSLAAIGILAVMVNSGLAISSIEKGTKLNWLHYCFSALSLIFTGFLITWTVNIVGSSLAYNYFGNTWLYIVVAAVFALCLVLQCVLYVVRWRRYG